MKYNKLTSIEQIEKGMVITFVPNERTIFVNVYSVVKYSSGRGYIQGRRVRPNNIEEQFGRYQNYPIGPDHFTSQGGVAEVVEGIKVVKEPTFTPEPTPEPAPVQTAEVDYEALRVMVKEEVEKLSGTITTIQVEYKEAPSVILPEQHHALLPELIDIVASGENVFLVGPAGTGKSTLAFQVSQALGIGFQPCSFGPGTLSSKLFGYMNATGHYVGTPYRKAWQDGELFLGDEIDNGNPGMVAELNQATANSHCAFADGVIKKHDDFRIVLTGNTYGNGPDRMFVGRNMLDKAFMDRFAVIDVPTDEVLERRLAVAYATPETLKLIEDWVTYVQAVRARVASHRLPIVVSPRASIFGARQLARGRSWERVAEIRLWKGLSGDDRRKVEY